MDRGRRWAVRFAGVLGMLWWLFGGVWWLLYLIAFSKLGLFDARYTVGPAVFFIALVLAALLLCWRTLLLRRWSAVLLCLLTWPATAVTRSIFYNFPEWPSLLPLLVPLIMTLLLAFGWRSLENRL